MVTDLLIILLLNGLTDNWVKGSTPDNIGTEFIIGFMENLGTSYDVSIFISTQRTSIVDVRVTAPRHTGTAISETFSITAPTVRKLVFNPDIRMSGTALGSKAIYITASDEIVVFGTNQEQYSNDGFLALPTDVLGQEYYTVTYHPPTRYAELLVVGVEDSTSVTITFGELVNSYGVYWNYNYYYSGDDLTLSINRFDTLELQTKDDLTGSKVTSNKKVAVFSGNLKTNIGTGTSSDHLVEMLVGIDYWGKNFLTVPIPKRTTGDVFKFIASKSGTSISLSGDCPTESFVINKPGRAVTKKIDSSHYCVVESNKGIMLVQFVQSQQSSSEPSDPAMMIIPAIPQYGADYTFSTPEYSLGSYDNHFMFVIKGADRAGLRWNGNDISSSAVYKKIAGTDYVGGYLMVPEGTHTIQHTSPIKVFGGYIYGNATYETYAFPTGMRLAPINRPCSTVAMVIGDGLDNDCDGLIDEELCNPSGQDDDGDGQIDEDCVDIDECTPDPCQNSGTCVDGIAQYSCRCVAGWTDKDCTTDIDECSSNPCQYNGTCNDAINGYTCTCVAGTNGVDCSNNIDECASTPCQNRGKCVDKINGYTCDCVAGYTGVHCATNIDECSSNPCQNGGTCVDRVNSYDCSCAPGYDGTHCSNNINECASNPCIHGNCIDEINGYSCNCDPGYTDNHCQTNIDECIGVTCQNGGTCRDRINMYVCACQPGYTGTHCETDIDECASNPCQNSGTCNDDVNRYTCTCAPGYTGTHCTIDIDECWSSPCMHGGTCNDEVNRFSCDCVAGYTDSTCSTNIDECSSSPCQHGGQCIDNINSYDCVCAAGYTGIHCEINIDECASSPCHNESTCLDDVNGYNCSCADGYEGVHCEIDIDECSSDPCQNAGECSDDVNGYQCTCPDDFIGENCETEVALNIVPIVAGSIGGAVGLAAIVFMATKIAGRFESRADPRQKVKRKASLQRKVKPTVINVNANSNKRWSVSSFTSISSPRGLNF